MSSLAKKERMRALILLSTALFSRILSLPLTIFLKRDPKLFVILGREQGKYLDNAKYFHIWLSAHRPEGVRVIFMTRHPHIHKALAGYGLEVARYPSMRAFWYLLRTGTLVADNMDWQDDGRIGLLAGARIVQLWHGAPLKEIELPLHERRRSRLTPWKRRLLDIYKSITGRYAMLDVLVSTSCYFTEKAFRPCFNSKKIINTGYPRNDILYPNSGYDPRLVDINVDVAAREAILNHRKGGGKTLVYSPTFRKSRISPFDSGHIVLTRLSDFAIKNNCLIAMKLHPLMEGMFKVSDHPNIVLIRSESDVYPLLSEFDLMITDYSSIYFDFLNLNRPIVFYPYDFKAYCADDRRLLLDYEEHTPGPKAYTLDQLIATLEEQLSPHADAYAAFRKRIFNLTFEDDTGTASRRIWDALNNE